MKARGRAGCLRVQVGDAVGAAELERDEVVDLVGLGGVHGDPVLGVHLLLQCLGHVAHAGRVAAAADVAAVGVLEVRPRRAARVRKRSVDLAVAGLRCDDRSSATDRGLNPLWRGLGPGAGVGVLSPPPLEPGFAHGQARLSQ